MAALPKFLPPSPIRLLERGDEKGALKSLTTFQNKDAALYQLQEFRREIRSKDFVDKGEVGCIELSRYELFALKTTSIVERQRTHSLFACC